MVVAIGGNLATSHGLSPLETCRWAASRLDGLCGLRLLAVSPWYETIPIPASGQPNYVNGVALLAGETSPERLLAALQRIEQQAGRTRGVANAARTLDLDIIAMGGLIRDAPDPILPHPRMHSRAFVLRPLLDVAPQWQHPVLQHTAAALLAALPDQGIRPLPPSHVR